MVQVLLRSSAQHHLRLLVTGARGSCPRLCRGLMADAAHAGGGPAPCGPLLDRVVVAGTFDHLHAGHYAMFHLAFARGRVVEIWVRDPLTSLAQLESHGEAPDDVAAALAHVCSCTFRTTCVRPARFVSLAWLHRRSPRKAKGPGLPPWLEAVAQAEAGLVPK